MRRGEVVWYDVTLSLRKKQKKVHSHKKETKDRWLNYQSVHAEAMIFNFKVAHKKFYNYKYFLKAVFWMSSVTNTTVTELF